MTPFKWEGFDRLVQALDRIPKEVEKKVLQEALLEAAEPIRGTMAVLAPRASGPGHGYRTGRHMGDAITVEVAKGDGPGEARVTIGPAGGDPNEFFYDIFLERGTSRLPAQPWMRPAFDQNRARALATLERAFVETVERVLREARVG